MHQEQSEASSNEELYNLLIQGLIAKDEKLLLKVLGQEDELVIKDIINRVPVNHVRKFVIELRNILSTKVSTNHLQWLQHLLALKYSVISSMADGRSILLPLVSLLDDRSSPDYYTKLQSLKGKLILLNQLREARRSDRAETVVKVPVEPEEPIGMEVDSETESEEEEFDDDSEEEQQEKEQDVAELEDDDNLDDDDPDDEEDDESEEELEAS